VVRVLRTAFETIGDFEISRGAVAREELAPGRESK